jgi:hypothetical protein
VVVLEEVLAEAVILEVGVQVVAGKKISRKGAKTQREITH